MINTLLEAKLITPQEYKCYALYTSELGREVIVELTNELFWEEPDEVNMTAGVLGFYFGRQSVIRGIKNTVKKVEAMIQKQLTEVPNE